MTRISEFAVGRRWYCDQGISAQRWNGRVPVTFVIIAKGDKPDEKVCKLEVSEDDARKYIATFESDAAKDRHLLRGAYERIVTCTHSHLKKHARLVP